MKKIIIGVFVLFLSGAHDANASSTQDVRLEGSATFLEGKFNGAGLNERGELVAGYRAARSAAVDEAAYVLSATQLRGKNYFGCGFPASVVSFDGKSAQLFAKFPGEFSVSAVESDGRLLYAAVLPSAGIYKVDEKGNTSAFADFSTGASAPNYVWDLYVYKGSLYASLGGHFPSVYKIDLKNGKKELLYRVEGKAKNVTALLVSDVGIFFGDDAGRVFRLDHGGTRPEVLYAFSDAEVRAIISHDGGLAVAVNSRRMSPPVVPPQPAPKDPGAKPQGDSPEESGEYGLYDSDLKNAIKAVAASLDQKIRMIDGAEDSARVPATVSTPVLDAKPTPPPVPAKLESPGAQSPGAPPMFQDPFGKGEGNLFGMSHDGLRVHRLWYSPTSAVLSIHPEREGIWVATSNPARLYQVSKAGRERLYFESASKDLSVVAGGTNGLIAAASNPAVLYELESSADGEYSSKVFDAGFSAKIGKADLTGLASSGWTIHLRSGATSDIDSGWSEYKLMGTTAMTSGRFFQIRLNFKSSDAAIRRIRIPYRVQNQYPRLNNLTSDVVRSQDGPPDAKEIRFQWDVMNLDNDVLAYQLYVQPPGSNAQIAVFEPGSRPQGVKHVTIPVEEFSDGVYRFRLEVTDEPTNGTIDALTHQGEFPLVLLDRTAPEVTIKREGESIRWRAVDSASRITRAEYRLDGSVWITLSPDDGLFDSSEEGGTFQTPGSISLVDVRCFDERENTRIYSLAVK